MQLNTLSGPAKRAWNPSWRKSVFTVDGLFFGMLYWPDVCYCPSCRNRYLKETGKELPVQSECSLEEWLDFCDSRADWISDLAQSVTDHVHKHDPNMPVEHNFSAGKAFSLCCRNGVSNASDYVGGDIYGGARNHAFICSLFRNMSKNQPFEYMTGRCSPGLKVHTVNKTEDELTRQALLTYAHHGAFLVIDAIDPIGTLDERVYSLIGKVNQKAAPYEPYLTGTLVEDVGIFYNIASAANLQTIGGEMKNDLSFPSTKRTCNNHTASMQASAHLISAHVPYGITTKEKKDTWQNYRILIVPNINRLEEDIVDSLIQYVEQGGCLYFNNCDEPRLFKTLIGGEVVKYTDTTMPYLFPAKGYEELLPNYNEKYPLPMEMSVPLVQGIDPSKIRAYIKLAYTPCLCDAPATFSSIHSNPPGISTEYPGIVETSYGKGKVIWSAGAIEFHEGRDYGIILGNILKMLVQRTFTITTTAPNNVELVSFTDGNKMRISAVNITEGIDFFTFPAFNVTVHTDKTALNVKLLPQGTSIPFTQGDNSITFPVEALRIMDMYEILFQ